MNEAAVTVASIEDFDGWLELAKEVEPLFGPMAAEKAFQDHLRASIARKSCFCIRSTAAVRKLYGAIAVSFDNNEISWLAVSKDERGKGLGRLLLAYAMDHLDSSKDIFVQTFAESSVEGLAARVLYGTFGFQDFKTGEPTPTGIPTVIMRKKEG